MQICQTREHQFSPTNSRHQPHVRGNNLVSPYHAVQPVQRHNLHIVHDVLDDYIIHATFSRYLASERAQALLHMKELEELGIYNESIIIFDRGYYSENMFRYCVEHGHLCVMRLKQSLCIAKILKPSKFDAYVMSI